MSLCGDEYLLQALVDGHLCPEEAAVVAAHCRECEPCGRLLCELELVCGLLQASETPAPRDLKDRLMAAVAGVKPLAPLTCEQAHEWVSLQLDGELDLEETQRLQAHLMACSACYAASKQLETTTAMLRAVGQEQPPAGLLERVQAAAEGVADSQPRVLRPAWQQWGVRLGGIAAAAALLVALLMNILQPASQLTPTAARGRARPAIVAEAPRTATTEPSTVAPTAPVRPAPVTPTSTSTTRPAPAGRVAATLPQPTSTRTVAPTPATSPSRPAPAPGRPERPFSPPMSAVAVSPVAPERVGPGEVMVPPMPAPMMARHQPDTPAHVDADAPRPVRVAMAEMKAMPLPVAAAPKPTAPRRTGWVSRPVESDREVYRSEDTSVRLATMRGELDRDAKQIKDAQVKGFVIN